MVVIIITTAKCNSHLTIVDLKMDHFLVEIIKTRKIGGQIQTDKLVELWKENIVLIESSRSHETWLKIRGEINKLGKEKTVLQCRNKIRNLKDIYKNAKENNVKTGSSSFPQYFHHFDEVPGCRAVVNMPEMI